MKFVINYLAGYVQKKAYDCACKEAILHPIFVEERRD
jgi:hypothetical protein